jgi:hypothetical protein
MPDNNNFEMEATIRNLPTHTLRFLARFVLTLAPAIVKAMATAAQAEKEEVVE